MTKQSRFSTSARRRRCVAGTHTSGNRGDFGRSAPVTHIAHNGGDFGRLLASCGMDKYVYFYELRVCVVAHGES